MEEKLIFTQLAKINKEVKAIRKTKKNEKQGFMYRGIDDIMNELHDLFAEYDVTIDTDILSYEMKEKMSKQGNVMNHCILSAKFTFTAIDGSFTTSTLLGEAMDNGDKSINKCTSIALKYCLLNKFLIPTQDMIDADRDSYELSKSKSVKKEPQSKIDNVKKSSNGKLITEVERMKQDDFLQKLHDIEVKKRAEGNWIGMTDFLFKNYEITVDEIKEVCMALGEYEQRTNQVVLPLGMF